MIFPYGDDQIKGGYKPYFSYTLISLNIIVFVLQGISPDALIGLAAVPGEITNGIDLHSLLTHMFLHGGFNHLLGNMIFLWIYADNVEATIGTPKFMAFYLLAGLVASFAQIMTSPDSMIPTVGASGAISGLMGAYLVLFPASKIKIFFLPFLRTFKVPAYLVLGLWIAMQLMSGFTTLSVSGESGGIAYWAHIGGFVFGLVAGFFFLKMLGKSFDLKRKNFPGLN